MTRRSRAREVAFQVLYQDDLNPRNDPALGDQLIRAPPAGRGLEEVRPRDWCPAFAAIGNRSTP